MTSLEAATNVIKTYLGKIMTAEGFNALYEISHGNNELLKEHINALKNIFEEASKELDKVLGGSDE